MGICTCPRQGLDHSEHTQWADEPAKLESTYERSMRELGLAHAMLTRIAHVLQETGSYANAPRPELETALKVIRDELNAREQEWAEVNCTCSHPEDQHTSRIGYDGRSGCLTALGLSRCPCQWKGAGAR